MSLRRRLALAFVVILGLFAINLGVSRWGDLQRTTNFRALQSALDAQLLVGELMREVEARRIEVLSIETFDSVGQGVSPESIEAMAERLHTTGEKTRRLQELIHDAGDVKATAGLAGAGAGTDPVADATAVVLDWSRLEDAWAPVYARRLEDAAAPSDPDDPASDAADGSVDGSVDDAVDDAVDDVVNNEERQRELRDSVRAALERLAEAQTERVVRTTESFDQMRAVTSRITAGAFTVSLLVALLVAIAVSTQLARGLGRLRRGARQIGDGDLDHRIPVRDVGAGDELDDLARELNEMADKLRTAHEKLDEARAAAVDASQAKSAFLANMSHELRTPMNAILGYTEMLLEDAEERGAEAARELQKILGAGRHLRSLIDDVLDLSKIEAGKATLYLEEIELRQILEDVLATCQPLVAENDNELQVDAADDLGLVRLDATKLRQILLNLLSNAAKFTSSGTVVLRARRRRATPPGGGPAVDRVRLEVEDTGIGMSDAQLERIFDPFTQADASTTRRYGGTGLGLAIAREHCHLMAGSLTATSAEGEGSRFIVDLPAVVDRAPEATTAVAAMPADAAD